MNEFEQESVNREDIAANANVNIEGTAQQQEPARDEPEIPINAADNTEKKNKKEKRTPIQVLYDYLETFCYALGVMMILLLFVFRMVSVSGESMRETLQDNDKLIISNLFYTPQTGDIVVISPETDTEVPIIKRVIATGGQTVYIDYENWEVFVDGEKLDEPYIEAMRNKYYIGSDMNPSVNSAFNQEFVVDDGCIFVMGDNRNGSEDSRGHYGFIDENRVLGRVIIRLAPNFGFVE